MCLKKMDASKQSKLLIEPENICSNFDFFLFYNIAWGGERAYVSLREKERKKERRKKERKKEKKKERKKVF